MSEPGAAPVHGQLEDGIAVSGGRPLLTVVVPFLNEKENLPVLYDRLVRVMAGQAEDLELLLVDDGSDDGSAEWVASKAASDPRVRLLRLSRNFGHQIAITAGLDHAEGDAVVIMDADLQDPPEVIPEMLSKWKEGFEVVYAVRKHRDGETWLKKFLAAAFYRVFRALCKIDIPLDAGDFRLVDRKVVGAVRSIREVHRFMRGLTAWVGYRQCAVVYNREARHTGKPKYTVWKSARLAWDAVISFSDIPFRWITLSSLLAVASGVLLALRLLVGRLEGAGTPICGWEAIASVLLVVGGIQLLGLSLIGQYMMRLYEESKRRPLYFLR